MNTNMNDKQELLTRFLMIRCLNYSRNKLHEFTGKYVDNSGVGIDFITYRSNYYSKILKTDITIEIEYSPNDTLSIQFKYDYKSDTSSSFTQDIYEYLEDHYNTYPLKMYFPRYGNIFHLDYSIRDFSKGERKV